MVNENPIFFGYIRFSNWNQAFGCFEFNYSWTRQHYQLLDFFFFFFFLRNDCYNLNILFYVSIIRQWIKSSLVIVFRVYRYVKTIAQGFGFQCARTKIWFILTDQELTFSTNWTTIMHIWTFSPSTHYVIRVCFLLGLLYK